MENFGVSFKDSRTILEDLTTLAREAFSAHAGAAREWWKERALRWEAIGLAIVNARGDEMRLRMNGASERLVGDLDRLVTGRAERVDVQGSDIGTMFRSWPALALHNMTTAFWRGEPIVIRSRGVITRPVKA